MRNLYRLAFWRLLEEIEAELDLSDQPGLLMCDARSDLHSSVQDRRLLDSYREWVHSRTNPTRLVELPWFGFSEFYVGLQLADFAAYLVDYISQEDLRLRGADELQAAFTKFEAKVRIVQIP